MTNDPTGTKPAPAPALLGLLSEGAGAALVALTAAIYSISFAVVVYAGPLAPFLSNGIGLTLMGSAAACLVLGWAGSLRGTVTHAQDVTMLVIAAALPALLASVADAAGGVRASPEALFATAVAFIAVTTAATGAAMALSGAMHLGHLARFLPFPVMSGLLVSIGYLLVTGGISLYLDRPVSVSALPEVAQDPRLPGLLPWLLGAALLLWATRSIRGRAVLPAGILLSFGLFHIALAVSGVSLPEAGARGFLLGPFPEAPTFGGLYAQGLTLVDWNAVLRNLPVLAALVPLALISHLLNVQAIGQAMDEEPMIDRDLRVTGVANLAAAAVGGLVAYSSISATLLRRRLHVRPWLAWGGTSAFLVALALAGADLLAGLPRGVFAMIVVFLGIDLFFGALSTELRRLSGRDILPIAAILATTVFVGLLPALVVGVLLTGFLFLFAYARLPFIRSDTSLALRRSIVERAEPDRTHLSEAGERVRVLELTGSLFFGTAAALRDRLRARVDQTPLDALALDFAAVRDVDASAAVGLARTVRECRSRGIAVHISGLSTSQADRMRRFGLTADEGGGGLAPLMIHQTVDDALQRLEADVLGNRAARTAQGGRETFLAELARAAPDHDLADIFPVVGLCDGEHIVTEGAPSAEIYVLLEGGARAVVDRPGGPPLVVARFEPGALIGEMAFFQGAARSATVVAEGPSRLMRIDAERLRTGGDLPGDLVVSFHRIAARHLSQRLDRATRLLRTARL